MVDKLFLESVRAALQGRPLQWEGSVTREEWDQLFQLAMQQSLLPMVYQSVHGCEQFRAAGADVDGQIRQRVRHMVVGQVIRTGDFLSIYRALAVRGLEPIVVKGILCRQLYPQPDQRISSDEDLYIPEGAFEAYCEALAAAGMTGRPWELEKAHMLHELAWDKKDSGLQVEIHKQLFDDSTEAYGGLNELFAQAFEQSIQVEIDGVSIRAMDHSHHLLFLILHALKHFMGSGFGLRQVCDIVLYAQAYGSEIDWQWLLECCHQVHAEIFTAALFDIGVRQLDFDPKRACYPDCWRQITVDSEPMLADLLSAGIYGNVDMSRKHSSNMTLTAVADHRRGASVGAGSGKLAALWRTVFLPRAVMAQAYPYVDKCALLLPVAWCSRIVKYLKESAGKADNRAADSIKLGNQRIELLKRYGVIK